MDLRNRRPSAGVVIGMTALVVALSGTAYGQDAVTAATKLVKSSGLASNAVTSAKVKDGSLLAKDFKKGQLPKGDTGPRGATGATGPQGAQGPAGTPNGYTKTEADGKFLATGGKAADADKLDGIDSTGFTKGNGSISSDYASVAAGGSATILDAGNTRLRLNCSDPAQASVSLLAINGASFNTGWVQDSSTTTANAAIPFNGTLNSTQTIAANQTRTATAGVVSPGTISGALTTTFNIQYSVVGSTCRASAQSVTRDSSFSLIFLP